MAPPPAKKQKTSSSSLAIFASPGMRPDVCLYVFTKEFHVSSAALKLNSTYFRKWLEPSGGKHPTSFRPQFQSEWFTQIDTDGTWGLTSDTKVRNCVSKLRFRDMDISTFRGSTECEENAFQNLLCAIFNRPYHIADATELDVMTQMADYYCALPTLSNSVSATFFNSPGLMNTLQMDLCQLLVSAYKLRHPLLFRDVLIYALGPWSSPRYLQLANHSDPCGSVLFKIAAGIHANLAAKIVEVQQSILQLATEYSGWSAAKMMLNFASRSVDANDQLMLPAYFRNYFDDTLIDKSTSKEGKQGKHGTISIQNLLRPLLTNKLTLDKAAVAGKGDFANSFLCFVISDKEFLWDQTQFDW